jgi:hypothetical protein
VVGQVASVDVSHAEHPYSISVSNVTNAAETRSILVNRLGGFAGVTSGVDTIGRYVSLRSMEQKYARAGE